jgi:hypothetical protein
MNSYEKTKIWEEIANYAKMLKDVASKTQDFQRAEMYIEELNKKIELLKKGKENKGG